MVWPVVGFCTSSDVPSMAAMVPEAPGNVLVPPLPLLAADEGAVDDVVEADEDDPHAARAMAASPRPERAAARRNRVAFRGERDSWY